MANTLTTWSHTTASYRILFISTFCWTQGFELVTLRWFSKWATTPFRPFLIAIFAWQIRSIKVVVVVAHFATFLLIRNSSLGNVISRIWMLLESFYPFHTPVCTRTTTTISVTRCCNRLKPKYFHGLSKKVTTSVFKWTLMFFKIAQKLEIHLGYSLNNLWPRIYRNRPIWSHWRQFTLRVMQKTSTDGQFPNVSFKSFLYIGRYTYVYLSPSLSLSLHQMDKQIFVFFLFLLLLLKSLLSQL